MADPVPPKDTRFKPGQSGNPAGRAPVRKVRKAIAHLKPAALAALGKSVLAGEQWGVTLWFHYTYGKPVDQVALIDKNGEAQTLSLTDEQLQARLEAILAKANAAEEPSP